MNSSHSPKQGEKPSWQIICVVDALDELNDDHAFLTALYEIARDKQGGMGEDLFRLLVAYLDTDPRQKLRTASQTLADIARSISNRPHC